MASTAETIKVNMMAGRGVGKRTAKSSEVVRRSHALKLVLLAGLACLVLVLMSAYAANLRRLNDDLSSQNAYLQAEIDSLEIKIGNSTNVNKIESIATKELGMIHPTSDNCIAIGDEKTESTNLAATIKDEAYD